MNIWIFNHYAGTPYTTQATRPYDLSKRLVKSGHNVTIFASSFSEYKLVEMRLKPHKKWDVEYCDGVRFVWLKTTPYKENNWRRILNMLSYAWRAFWVGIGIKQKPDVIIGVSVHPFAALSASLLSILKGTRFFHEITDLWPQTLVDMGKLSNNNPITWALRLLERFLYKKSEKIVALLPHADDYIVTTGTRRDKVVWIPNGVDLYRYRDIVPYDGHTSGVFTVMYLGRHGKANAVDTILKAAQTLQNAGHNNIRFVFIGDGPEKANLVNLSHDLNLQNVEFKDAVPKQEIATVMSNADAFILVLKDIPLYKYGISANKLFEYLISGRPIVFGGNSRNNPVKEAGAGITVEPENPNAIAEAITQLVAMTPKARVEMGNNGLKYVKEHYDMDLLASKLQSLL